MFETGGDLFPAVLVGLALAGLALALRLGIHVGTRPGGVDTWYYLASADAFRKTRRLPVSLPQYLLQDRTESYPPGFVVFLSLFPSRLLRRWFWILSPAIDALHLLALYVVTLRLTGSLAAAAVAAGVYALTPQLIAESRNLNPRTLGVILSSLAMFLVLRSVLPAEAALDSRLGPQPWYIVGLAVVGISMVFLTHTTSGVAFGVATFALSLVTWDWRYLGFTLAGFAAAFALSGGFYLRVLENHLHAARFWRRNLRYRGAHQLQDSPVYGGGQAKGAPTAGWQAGGTVRSAVRLLGENPFLVPMLLLFTPVLLAGWWGQQMYWWAVAILGWAVATTFVKPLRIFGPGYLYMKASVFPAGFSLALVIDVHGWVSPAGVIIGLSFLASVAAIAVFYAYIRTRKSEHTASTPPDLEAIAMQLAGMAGDGVLCLPTMYSDFVSYASGKRVLWGGHSGDLSRFESLYPVVRQPLDELIQEYGLDYVLLDLGYADPERLRLNGCLRPVASSGPFTLYRTLAGDR